MGKTSKSQIKAVRAYEKRNPALTYYQTRRNNARAFVSSSAERFEEAKQQSVPWRFGKLTGHDWRKTEWNVKKALGLKPGAFLCTKI